ncbi:WD40-repeat-containing domain protein [Lasiosphaeria miniovina]|uniref:WD40-repeat-containing domain protein n=1 Tax=Lasiosphaeria miniovina TaxID=1954250 RepID=A0AA40B5N7_9PEZI|nr:WD40-repeat-containing domain protein [Lasiosphaeria miniovina]KAK0728159.1 WD40-repeat-containing domain protein [Lasiosphaeria miniovina]
MSSFFTAPSGDKKRKRIPGTEGPKKRLAGATPKPSINGHKSSARLATPGAKKKAAARDEEISGSELDSDLSGDDNRASGSESENEGETAAEKRLRLAQRYLEKTRQEVELEDEYAFDAEQIDRDLLAERLEEDAAESKGKVYRRLAPELDFGHAAHTQFRWNSKTVTSVAVCAPYAYTTTKEGCLTKWRLQDLPKDQWPQTTRKKPKKPPAPPKRKPERVCYTTADPQKIKDKTFKGHTGGILTVRASQDGKYVVTGGSDKRMVVHNAEDLKPIRAFTQHRDAVTGLAFRRGTNQLFSCSKDRTVKVWSLDELAYVETLFGHQDEIVDVDALGQERCVSVGARDRTARYWKVPEESQLVFRGGASEKKSSKSSAALQGIAPGSLAQEGSMDRVSMLDDDLFVTGSDNGDLALWSVNRKKALFVVPRAHGIDPALKPSEASAEADPGPDVVPAPQPRSITALRTIPYSDVILTGSWDGCVRVWRLNEDKKKIEAAGVLGSSSADEENEGKGKAVGSEQEGQQPQQEAGEKDLVRGIVNDIAMFERGDRGRDGICVVIATGKEMRLGRWKYIKDGRCGAMVFEVPKIAKQAGVTEQSTDDEEE